ncbi:MAG: hypothetical protein HOP33_07685 [Verrucomicrobia bacterium]|nr:hypothetical protein [Verrucomicrobiota bacterium]
MSPRQGCLGLRWQAQRDTAFATHGNLPQYLQPPVRPKAPSPLLFHPRLPTGFKSISPAQRLPLKPSGLPKETISSNSRPERGCGNAQPQHVKTHGTLKSFPRLTSVDALRLVLPPSRRFAAREFACWIHAAKYIAA